jgi:hypothetical protein
MSHEKGTDLPYRGMEALAACVVHLRQYDTGTCCQCHHGFIEVLQNLGRFFAHISI